MVIDAATIIYFASLLGAVGAILAVMAKAHNWYLKQEMQDQEIAEIKAEQQAIRAEQKVICKGLHAALDGLEQLGANHSVPAAKEMLADHLNEAAHN